jgi:hypothetical protein
MVDLEVKGVYYVKFDERDKFDCDSCSDYEAYNVKLVG